MDFTILFLAFVCNLWNCFRAQGLYATRVLCLFLLVTLSLKLQAPKAAVGFKDLKIDISKTGGLDPVLNVQINIVPIFIQALAPDSTDNSSVFSKLDGWVRGQYCSAMDTSDCSSFLFEDISLSCDLHQR
jgi:hypothetical protein